MSRINLKKPLAVFLSLTLILSQIVPVHGADNPKNSDELYFAAYDNEVVENVQTGVVTKGEFIVKDVCRASIVYENVSYVFNEINSGNVIFQGMLVSDGDLVNTGDPIAEVSLSVNVETVDELEAYIGALEESLESYITTNSQLLNRYKTLAESSPSAADRRVAQLLYDRLYVNYNDELQEREDFIEAQKATLSTYKSLRETQYITAPMSGKVSNISRIWRGQTLDNWAYICSIYDTENVRLEVISGGENLSYNQAVQVVSVQKSQNVLIDGRVTSCSSPTLSSNLVGKTKYITFIGDPSNMKIGEDVSVRYESIHTQNAILVPKKAVETDNGGTYVNLYKDGHQFKQYFISGGVNADNYWAVMGLNEGDVVVLH